MAGDNENEVSETAPRGDQQKQGGGNPIATAKGAIKKAKQDGLQGKLKELFKKQDELYATREGHEKSIEQLNTQIDEIEGQAVELVQNVEKEIKRLS